MRTGALNDMGSQKVVSSAELMRIAGTQDKQTRIYQWHSTSIVLKKLLTIEEYLCCVNNIIKYCEDSEGGFAIELLDFSLRVNIVMAYANVTLPENIDELYYLMYSSDLYETVCNAVNRAQIEAILRVVSSLYASGPVEADSLQ